MGREVGAYLAMGARFAKRPSFVIPAKAGTHGYGAAEAASRPPSMGPDFRRDDGFMCGALFLLAD